MAELPDPRAEEISRQARLVMAVAAAMRECARRDVPGQGSMPCEEPCRGVVSWSRSGPQSARAHCDRCNFRMMS